MYYVYVEFRRIQWHCSVPLHAQWWQKAPLPSFPHNTHATPKKKSPSLTTPPSSSSKSTSSSSRIPSSTCCLKYRKLRNTTLFGANKLNGQANGRWTCWKSTFDHEGRNQVALIKGFHLLLQRELRQMLAFGSWPTIAWLELSRGKSFVFESSLILVVLVLSCQVASVFSFTNSLISKVWNRYGCGIDMPNNICYYINIMFSASALKKDQISEKLLRETPHFLIRLILAFLAASLFFSQEFVLFFFWSCAHYI